MLRCFIADDEAPARQRLRRLLASFEEVTVVGEAADGVSTLEAVSAEKPDVLLLDIDMPELDGLAVAAALPIGAPAIVFVTAYDEHALKAFELSAVDYLVKPVSRERLQAALGKASRQRGSAVDMTSLLAQLDVLRPLRRMAVRCGAKFVVFDPARVHAILARDHYSTILCGDAELLSDDPLDSLASRFDNKQFIRVHRSALINLSSLRELVHTGDRRYVAVLSDPAGSRVPVSRERLAGLKTALGLD
jgi:two-component system, LytTR family, response regulator